MFQYLITYFYLIVFKSNNFVKSIVFFIIFFMRFLFKLSLFILSYVFNVSDIIKSTFCLSQPQIDEFAKIVQLISLY